MYCYKCGKQIPDDSAFCSYCGATITTHNAEEPQGFRLIIDRKSQLYLVNPPIKVTIDGSTFLSVDNGKFVEVTVSPGIHTIDFKASFRSKTLEIDIQKDTVVEIGFNRMTGAITADIT